MKATLALAAAALLWAGNYVVGGAAVHAMDPIALTWFRWLLAALPLLLLAQLIERPRWRAVLAEWPRLLLLAVLGVAATPCSSTARSSSRRRCPRPSSTLRTQRSWCCSRPCCSASGSGPAAAAGLVLGLVGVLLVITDGRIASILSTAPNEGDLLMVGAIVVWSLYTIAGRSLAAPPIAATGVQAAMTAVLLAPVALLTGAHWPAQTSTVEALLFIALLPSVGAYALWNLAAKHVPAGRAGLSLNLITVFTVIISVVLGARLTVPEIVGGLLVFAGVALGSLGPRRQRRTDPALAQAAVRRRVIPRDRSWRRDGCEGCRLAPGCRRPHGGAGSSLPQARFGGGVGENESLVGRVS